MSREVSLGFISELDARSHCAYCAGNGTIPDPCGCSFNLDIIDCNACGGSGIKTSACPACK